jgi:enoyl-CoA hydratase
MTIMSTDKVILRKAGAVARIILNNPSRHNAMSMEMQQAIEGFVDDLAQDAAIRVVVISGAGGRAFSAGADISEFERRHADAATVRANARESGLNAKLERLDKPTIAEIEGYCMGGGLVLALCCDLRICSEDARFAIPPARLGNGYGHRNIERVMNVVGLPNTREILFTGRQFAAEEAFAMGLVNRIVPKGELAGYVAQYAETIAHNAPLTVTAIKRITLELKKERGERDLRLCDELVAACFASEDYQEGRRAFMEKRRPVFTGR